MAGGMCGKWVCIVGSKIYQLKNDHTRDFSLPPANEVWGKVIFSEVCVKNSVHRGEYLGRYPPDQVHPPGPGTPPRPGTPPGRYTYPRDQVPPIGTPPGSGTLSRTRYPPEKCMLGDTGNKRAVSILLECILVFNLYRKFVKFDNCFYLYFNFVPQVCNSYLYKGCTGIRFKFFTGCNCIL